MEGRAPVRPPDYAISAFATSLSIAIGYAIFSITHLSGAMRSLFHWDSPFIPWKAKTIPPGSNPATRFHLLVPATLGWVNSLEGICHNSVALFLHRSLRSTKKMPFTRVIAQPPIRQSCLKAT